MAQKFCVDCRHYRRVQTGIQEFEDQCFAQANEKTSLVSGRSELHGVKPCGFMRLLQGSEGCGEEGRFREKKNG